MIRTAEADREIEETRSAIQVCGGPPVRSKIFVMSMGLAASVWLTGCQNTNSAKTVTVNSSGSTTAAKLAPEKKDTLRADMSRAPSEKTEKTSRLGKGPLTSVVPAASCASCAKCSSCGGDLAAKGTTTVACATCAAKSDSSSVVPATLPPVSNQPKVLPASIPQPAIAPPPAVPAALAPIASAPSAPEIVTIHNPPLSPPPLGGSFGPGVEIVSGSTNPTDPAAPAEKTAAGAVMTVRFGQSNNYQTVVGQVYQFRRTWKLRYTAVESEDRYGGSFNLVGDGLENLKDGQMVRVEGSVMPSDDRAGSARYQVTRIEVIEQDLK